MGQVGTYRFYQTCFCVCLSFNASIFQIFSQDMNAFELKFIFKRCKDSFFVKHLMLCSSHMLEIRK